MPTPSTEIVDGGKLRLTIGTAVVARATNCNFSSKNNVRKTAHKDQTGGFTSNDYGTIEATISSDFLVCETTGGAKDLLTAKLAKTKVAWVYGTGVSGDLKLSGTAAVISQIDLKGPVSENATGSITLEIDGAYTVGTFA